MKFERQIKYYYLRFIRLRGEPHELALGMAFGVFAGMMPIIPFQIAVAVTLALFFKGSKIAAALGTWVSNPLNWYFLYYYNYKLGAFLLGITEQNKILPTITAAMQSGEEPMVIVGKILGVGGISLFVFFLGGLVMATASAIPSYFIFLPIFRRIRYWKEERRRKRAQ